jgi:hypothetical protein
VRSMPSKTNSFPWVFTPHGASFLPACITRLLLFCKFCNKSLKNCFHHIIILCLFILLLFFSRRLIM